MLAELFPLQHWLAVHFGIGTSPKAVFWYSFWSGTGSDLGELTLVASIALFAKMHFNCHEQGCLRIARHHYVDSNGVKILLCPKHHPTLPEGSLAEHAARDAAGTL